MNNTQDNSYFSRNFGWVDPEIDFSDRVGILADPLAQEVDHVMLFKNAHTEGVQDYAFIGEGGAAVAIIDQNLSVSGYVETKVAAPHFEFNVVAQSAMPSATTLWRNANDDDKLWLGPDPVDTDTVTVVEAGENVTVTGNGRPDDPYIVNADDVVVQAGDNVTVTGDGSSGDPYVIASDIGLQADNPQIEHVALFKDTSGDYVYRGLGKDSIGFLGQYQVTLSYP